MVSSQAAVAKGDAIKQLRQERLIVIRYKNEVYDNFYRIVINSRIESLGHVMMELCKPPAPAPVATPAATPRQAPSRPALAAAPAQAEVAGITDYENEEENGGDEQGGASD